MINSNMIRAKIVEKGMNQQQMAEQLGMSAKTFSIKMKNGKFGLDEAEKMIKILEIDKPEIYFFNKAVT